MGENNKHDRSVNLRKKTWYRNFYVRQLILKLKRLIFTKISIGDYWISSQHQSQTGWRNSLLLACKNPEFHLDICCMYSHFDINFSIGFSIFMPHLKYHILSLKSQVVIQKISQVSYNINILSIYQVSTFS